MSRPATNPALKVRLVTLLTLALVVAACDAPTLTTSTTTPSVVGSGESSSTSASTMSSSSSTSSTSTTAPGPLVGLITPTGIPVAVTSITAEGYEVLTPCGFTETIDRGSAMGPTTVVIDPGHGGAVDTGAVGQNGLAEKEVNLNVARVAERLLAERGIDVVLTRTGDYATPLSVRVNLADALQAEIMVSVHHNAPSMGSSEAPGTEVFVQSGSKESNRLGGLLFKHVREALDAFDVAWVAAVDAGVMTVVNSRGTDAYGIIRGPNTTTALVELGYIANPPEAELFSTDIYVRTAGEAVADGVAAYLETNNQGSGFVEGRIFNPGPGVGQEDCIDPALG